MPTSRARRAATLAAAAAFVLHTVTVVSVFWSWGFFGRGNVITWLDFPASLLYLQWTDQRLLWWSVVAGGIQWAAVAALLAWWLGLAVRRRSG
jgi:hypothetical protein